MKILNKISYHWKSWKATRLSKEEIKKLTLYPEVPQKKLGVIRNELYWLCRNRRRISLTIEKTIMDYFNMGIDREGVDIHQYIFRSEAIKIRNARQPRFARLLTDKWITSLYLRSCGIDTPPPLFVKSPFMSSEEALSKLKLSHEKKFFAKPVNGIMGRGTFSFSMSEKGFEIDGESVSDDELVEKLEGCIVEPFIDQHDALTHLGPDAVSTIRFITVYNKDKNTVRKRDKIEILLSYAFIPANGAKNSHTNQGSILLSVDESGKLGEIGLQLAGERGKHTVHPDTKTVFKGFQIPYWKEATDLVIRVHQCFPEIHSVGWDVAITKTGPLLIEGNHDWGLASFQYVYGPGREFIEKHFM